MSHIRHHQVPPWATGPLTLLESIAKVPDRQVGQNRQIVYLLSISLSSSLSQASTITVEAITTIQMRKNSTNHRVLNSLFIMIIALNTFFSGSQALQCYT